MNISSAKDAVSALACLKAVSAIVEVNFTFPNGGLQFWGKVLVIDESELQITGAQPEQDFAAAPFLKVGPLKNFSFGGEFQEGESGLSLILQIKRRGRNSEAFHIHLSAKWARPN